MRKTANCAEERTRATECLLREQSLRSGVAGRALPRHGEGGRGTIYSFAFTAFAISPITPRRKASTQAMKIRPWMTVTQEPYSAR